MKKVFTIVLMAAALMAVNSQVEAQTKIGYISLAEIIPAMAETKKADTSLSQFRDALVANANDRQTTLQEDIEKFNRDSSKLTSVQKDVKRKDLQKKLQELSGEEQRIQEQLQQKQEEYLAPIQKKALDAVSAVAKEGGYTYVFLKDALVVYPPADDLAPLVKKKLGIK